MRLEDVFPEGATSSVARLSDLREKVLSAAEELGFAILPIDEPEGRIRWVAVANSARTAARVEAYAAAFVGRTYSEDIDLPASRKQPAPRWLEGDLDRLPSAWRAVFSFTAPQPAAVVACLNSLWGLLKETDSPSPSGPPTPSALLRAFEESLVETDLEGAEAALTALRIHSLIDATNIHFLEVLLAGARGRWAEILESESVQDYVLKVAKRPRRVGSVLLQAVYEVHLRGAEQRRNAVEAARVISEVLPVYRILVTPNALASLSAESISAAARKLVVLALARLGDAARSDEWAVDLDTTDQEWLNLVRAQMLSEGTAHTGHLQSPRDPLEGDADPAISLVRQLTAAYEAEDAFSASEALAALGEAEQFHAAVQNYMGHRMFETCKADLVRRTQAECMSAAGFVSSLSADLIDADAWVEMGATLGWVRTQEELGRLREEIERYAGPEDRLLMVCPRLLEFVLSVEGEGVGLRSLQAACLSALLVYALAAAKAAYADELLDLFECLLDVDGAAAYEELDSLREFWVGALNAPKSQAWAVRALEMLADFPIVNRDVLSDFADVIVASLIAFSERDKLDTGSAWTLRSACKALNRPEPMASNGALAPKAATPAEGSFDALAKLPRRTAIGIYTLQPGAGQRAKERILSIAPNLDIRISSARVGGAPATGFVRGCSVVVISTNRATHAATRAIEEEARRSGVEVLLLHRSGSTSICDRLADWAMTQLAAQIPA